MLRLRVRRGGPEGGGTQGGALKGTGDMGEMPEVGGLALLHPTTGQDGEGGLSFTRLLGASRCASQHDLNNASVKCCLLVHVRGILPRTEWAPPGFTPGHRRLCPLRELLGTVLDSHHAKESVAANPV